MQAETLLEQVPNPATEACQVYTWAVYHTAREEWPQARERHLTAVHRFGAAPGNFIQACLDLLAAKIAAGLGEQEPAELKFRESLVPCNIAFYV